MLLRKLPADSMIVGDTKAEGDSARHYVKGLNWLMIVDMISDRLPLGVVNGGLFFVPSQVAGDIYSCDKTAHPEANSAFKSATTRCVCWFRGQQATNNSECVGGGSTP